MVLVMASNPTLKSIATVKKDKAEQNNNAIKSCKIIQAIIRNDVMLCENILKEGFIINAPLSYLASSSSTHKWHLYATALHVACMYRQVGIIKLLLEHGADPNQRDWLSRTPIHLISDYWPLKFYSDNFSLVNNPEDLHFDQLHQVSVQCLEILLLHGADVNLKLQSFHGETALHLAAKSNFTLCLPTLMKYHIDLNSKDIFGRTPLMISANYQSVQMMEKLIIGGANLNCTDNRQTTFLHFLCGRNMPELKPIFKLLLEKNVNVNCQTVEGNTPLHFAAAAGNEIALDILLHFGANPDIRNNCHLSPLYIFLDKDMHANKLFGIQRLVAESPQIFIHNSFMELPRLLLLPAMKKLYTYLIQFSENVSRLDKLCRHRIRQSLGTHNLRQSNCLKDVNYPLALKTFIVENYVLEWPSNILN